MKVVSKIRSLGFGFVFESVFERFVPAWMLRFCSLSVYQLNSEKLSGATTSPAHVKTCDRELELDHLREITADYSSQNNTIGLLAKVNDEVAGGLWMALGDYQDHDLGLSFLLGDEGGWVYSARVDAAHRRKGIYSRLMFEAAKTRASVGGTLPLIGVSGLNKASHKAIQRVATPVGKVKMFRLGPVVWARSTGGLQQNQSLTLQCTRHPIEVRLA